MKRITDGIHKFQEHVQPQMATLFHTLAKGQNPIALFITCSDSRVDPGLITQTPPGTLFVMQNPGNFVPPPDSRCEGIDATVEYAVSALSVPNIIVCGHSDCGAMKALMDESGHGPDLSYWLRHAKHVRTTVRQRRNEFQSPKEMLDFAVEQNVILQLDNLRTHTCVAQAIDNGKLTLHGWIYDIETGGFKCYMPKTGSFVPLT